MAAFVEDLLNSRLVRRHMPVVVLAFGLVLCAWLMGSRLRALTHFSASIHTRNISFVAGHRTNTAGLFNSGKLPSRHRSSQPLPDHIFRWPDPPRYG